jgi:hypothetical protein
LTQDVFSAAAMTAALVPGMTLVGITVMLTNAAYRRKILGRIDDPIGLGPFWADFESKTEMARANAVAPVLRRLRPFLMRPMLRRMLGQADPRFDLRQVYDQKKILLVNLAKGQLGPETSALLGSLVIGNLWQVALGRAAIPQSQRSPVFLYLDEFQEYLRLPLDLTDALSQARGLGLALIMANQNLAQLRTDVRTAVLANARSKVCMQLAADDARVMASGSRLDPEDFTGLGAYECYLQLLTGNAVQPWVSGRTFPPPKPISDVEEVRERSRSNYGRDQTEVDAAIGELLGLTAGDGEADDLKPRLRRSQP